MTGTETISSRIRATVAALGAATQDQIYDAVPDANPQLIYALVKAKQLVRTGAPGAHVYKPGRTPRVYGGSPEQRLAARERRNERMRSLYAAERGGTVKPRARPAPKPLPPLSPRVRKAPDPRVLKRPRPTSAQQVVVIPARTCITAKTPRKHQPMTSQEWEAQGGKVERLAFGVVTHSELRHTYTA